MVANLYEEQYGISLPLYPKQRMDAELKARNVLGRNEVNMDMIFEYLSDYSEEEKSRLRFLGRKNRRICNYLRIKRLFGLLEN